MGPKWMWLYKKRRLEHRKAQKDDHVKTKGKNDQAEERGLRRNQPRLYPDPEILVSRILREKFHLFRPPHLRYLLW